MTRVRQALAVTRLFLRRSILHPHTIASTFLTPIVIALIFGTADARAVSQISIGVLVEHSQPSGRALVAAVDAEPGVTVRAYDNRVELVRAVRRADVAAGMYVPVSGPVQVIGDQRDPVSSAARADILSVAARGGVRIASNAGRVAVTELSTGKRAHQTGLPRAAAGMLVYFVFANAVFTSWFLLEDRARGVLLRAASCPVSARSIAAGEVLGRFAIALVQAVLVAVVSSVVFQTTWGAMFPFLLVLVALSAVAAGTSVLLGVVIARPGPQATSAGTAVVAVTALFGGCFWSLTIVPAGMRTIAYITPEAWTLRAVESLAARGGGIVDILPDLAVLAGFAVALFALAGLVLRRASVIAGSPA